MGQAGTRASDRGDPTRRRLIRSLTQSSPIAYTHDVVRKGFETMNDAERRTMDRAYDLWGAEREAVDEIHAAIKKYADLVFTEWTEVRGCTNEAALGVVKDRLKVLGTDGITDHLNRLYRDKM